MDSQQTCRRCGTCCRRGGPALHQEDLPLLTQGVLHTGVLLTLRKGEPVFDQPAGAVRPLPEELVKIQYAAEGLTCRYYQEQRQECGIYEQRPLECRLQACWDDSAIRAAYDQGRLTRRDLLPEESAAWQLAAMHEAQCSYAALALAATRLLERPCPESEAAVLELLELDAAIRAGLARRLEQPQLATQGYCLFLFGRPMEKSLPFYGLRGVREQGRLRLLRLGTRPTVQDEGAKPCAASCPVPEAGADQPDRPAPPDLPDPRP